MNKLNESLLYKASDDVLAQLKNDAEDCLKSWHETELIISQKANSMLQFLVPSAIAIFGFMIDRYNKIMIDNLVVVCFIEIIILSVSIYYIYRVVSIKITALYGVTPSDMLTEHVFNDYKHYLRNRIFGLQDALDHTEVVHLERIKSYKIALKTMVIGTFIVFIVFSLLAIL